MGMGMELADGVEHRIAPSPASSTLRPDAQRLYATALTRILKQVSDQGSATISELTAIAGVSRPTVQRALAELEEFGVVRESELRLSETGRPARTWSPATGRRLVMGVDIRRTDTRVSVHSLTGRPIADDLFTHAELLSASRTRIGGVESLSASGARTGSPEQPDASAAVPRLILQRVADLLESGPIDRADIVETVIAVSGIVADDGTVLLSTGVPGLTGCPLRQVATEVIGLPSVQVENDMNLRAVGELHTGVARGLSSFVYITNHGFHRPAVVLGGNLWHGHHRTVGEGDLLTDSGVISTQLTHAGRTVDYFDVAPMIDDGSLSRDWLTPLNSQLATVIALTCYTLDPQAVIVHGGPRTTDQAAIQDLEARFRAYSVTSDAPRILAAGHGQDLTMSGALVLALREALSRVLGISDPLIPAIQGSASQESRT